MKDCDLFRCCWQMLCDRFKEFAHETELIGQERVAAVNDICDQLIAAGHSDAATIAEWKDGINEAWTDLLELIDTRTQALAASWELHKFFHDCKETLLRIHVRPVAHLQLVFTISTWRIDHHCVLST